MNPKAPDWPREHPGTNPSPIDPCAPSPTRIVVAAVYPLLRDGIRRALEGTEFVVLGEAASMDDVLPSVRTHRPDLVLLHDTATSGLPLPVLRACQSVGERTMTVVMAHPQDTAQTVEAVRLGAVGVLTPNADAGVLLRCLRAVCAGTLWIPRESIAQLIAAPSRQPQCELGRPFGLTQRELDVVRSVAEGYSNREIAQRLAVKEDTVKHHVSAAFDKTGTFSRVELALFALHHQLARPEQGRDRSA